MQKQYQDLESECSVLATSGADRRRNLDWHGCCTKPCSKLACIKLASHAYSSLSCQALAGIRGGGEQESDHWF